MLAGRRGIYYRISRSILPEYYDVSSQAYRVIHEQLADLESRGLVQLIWSKSNSSILEKVRLSTEPAHIEEAYRLLVRTRETDKDAVMRNICLRYEVLRDKSPAYVPAAEIDNDDVCDIWLGAFLDDILRRLDEHKSIKRYADKDDPEAFERLCMMLYALPRSREDVYLREFSAAVFNDSKTAEQLIGRAAAVIRGYSSNTHMSMLEDMTNDEILEYYGVYRNPAWTYVKGCGRIRFGSRTGYLGIRNLSEGIGLTGRDLRCVEWDPDCAPARVVTIENLTSYYQWNVKEGETGSCSDTLIIYLGGYASPVQREFLIGLHSAYPDADYLHFGDIDAGGFRIWRSLRKGTGIDFKTLGMNIETWQNAVDSGSGKPLTSEDINALTAMKQDPYYAGQHELFENMLRRSIKIEQESVVLCTLDLN